MDLLLLAALVALASSAPGKSNSINSALKFESMEDMEKLPSIDKLWQDFKDNHSKYRIHSYKSLSVHNEVCIFFIFFSHIMRLLPKYPSFIFLFYVVSNEYCRLTKQLYNSSENLRHLYLKKHSFLCLSIIPVKLSSHMHLFSC